MAILVLPLNSALNPFLYTFNLAMERRRKQEEARLLKIVEARLVAQRMESVKTTDLGDHGPRPGH
jgi:hypothetical protein